MCNSCDDNLKKLDKKKLYNKKSIHYLEQIIGHVFNQEKLEKSSKISIDDRSKYISHKNLAKRINKNAQILSKFFDKKKKQFKKKVDVKFFSKVFQIRNLKKSKIESVQLRLQEWENPYLETGELKDIYNEIFIPEIQTVYSEVTASMVTLHPRRFRESKNMKVSSRILDEFQGFIEKLSLKTTNKVNNAIEDIVIFGIEDGKSNKDIAADILKKFDRLKKYEAVRIARTETSRAMGRGALAAYNKLDVIEYNLLPSVRACPLCIAVASKNPYDINDISGRNPIHPNCTCSIEPHKFKGEENPI